MLIRDMNFHGLGENRTSTITEDHYSDIWFWTSPVQKPVGGWESRYPHRVTALWLAIGIRGKCHAGLLCSVKGLPGGSPSSGLQQPPGRQRTRRNGWCERGTAEPRDLAKGSRYFANQRLPLSQDTKQVPFAAFLLTPFQGRQEIQLLEHSLHRSASLSLGPTLHACSWGSLRRPPNTCPLLHWQPQPSGPSWISCRPAQKRLEPGQQCNPRACSSLWSPQADEVLGLSAPVPTSPGDSQNLARAQHSLGSRECEGKVWCSCEFRGRSDALRIGKWVWGARCKHLEVHWRVCRVVTSYPPCNQEDNGLDGPALERGTAALFLVVLFPKINSWQTALPPTPFIAVT